MMNKLILGVGAGAAVTVIVIIALLSHKISSLSEDLQLANSNNATLTLANAGLSSERDGLRKSLTEEREAIAKMKQQETLSQFEYEKARAELEQLKNNELSNDACINSPMPSSIIELIKK